MTRGEALEREARRKRGAYYAVTRRSRAPRAGPPVLLRLSPRPVVTTLNLPRARAALAVLVAHSRVEAMAIPSMAIPSMAIPSQPAHREPRFHNHNRSSMTDTGGSRAAARVGGRPRAAHALAAAPRPSSGGIAAAAAAALGARHR